MTGAKSGASDLLRLSTLRGHHRFQQICYRQLRSHEIRGEAAKLEPATMLRSFSQLFTGPIVTEKGGKEMEGPVDEASTASGEETSDGAEDGASDMSVEAQPGSENESAEDRSGSADAPQPAACSHAAPDSVSATEEGPTCVETTERRMVQIEESDGDGGERGVKFAITSAAVDDADVVRGSPVRRPTPVSQTGDGQARRRALKRYKEDANGQWVKGRAHEDGRWLPEPGAAAFPTLELAMEHERHKTLLRRASWANLRGEVAGTRKAVTEEGVRTRHHQSKEAEETRRSVEEARDALAAKVDEGVKALSAHKQGVVRDSSSASKISFYSMVFSNLRAQDMKDLLMSRDIEPVGAKCMLAQLVVTHLEEEDVEEFVISRSSKRRRVDVPSGNQTTLDVLFGAA